MRQEELTAIAGDAISNHRSWLSNYDRAYLTKWERMFNADPQAAACEAVARDILAARVDQIDPADDPSSGGPDFACRAGAARFYVETKCLLVDTITKATRIRSEPYSTTSTARMFIPLTDAIMSECAAKAKQCSGLDAPCLLLLGTFHLRASICLKKRFLEEVLTASTEISLRVDPATGRAVTPPVHSTSLKNSAFIRLDKVKQDIEAARKSISGLLVVNMAMQELNVRGLLHPEAARPFDPRLLPSIPFGRLKDEYKLSALGVIWENEVSDG